MAQPESMQPPPTSAESSPAAGRGVLRRNSTPAAGLKQAGAGLAFTAPGRDAKSTAVRAALLDRWVTSAAALLDIQDQEGQHEYVRAIAIHKPKGGEWHLIVKGAGKAKERKVPIVDAETCSGTVRNVVLGFFGIPFQQGVSYSRVKGFGNEMNEVVLEVLVQGEPIGNPITAVIDNLLEEVQWSPALSWAQPLEGWNGDSDERSGRTTNRNAMEAVGFWEAECFKRRQCSQRALKGGYDDSTDDYEVELSGYPMLRRALFKAGLLESDEEPLSVPLEKIVVVVSAMARQCCCNAEQVHEELREAEARLQRGLGSPSMKLLDESARLGALKGTSAEQKGQAVRRLVLANRQMEVEEQRGGESDHRGRSSRRVHDEFTEQKRVTS